MFIFIMLTLAPSNLLTVQHSTLKRHRHIYNICTAIQNPSTPEAADDGDDGVKIKLPERLERRGFVDEFTED